MANPPLRAILAGCESTCGSWLPHIIAHPETVCIDNVKSLAMVFGAVESAGRSARVEIVA